MKAKVVKPVYNKFYEQILCVGDIVDIIGFEDDTLKVQDSSGRVMHVCPDKMVEIVGGN